MITVSAECDGVEGPDLNLSWIQNICESILTDNGYEDGSITFIFSNDNSLRKLKKEYFQQDVFTDVISFNLEDEGDAIEGEIYISLDRVKENARQFKQDFLQELKRIIAHGTLHLMGYDDQSLPEKEKMIRLEDSYLSRVIAE